MPENKTKSTNDGGSTIRCICRSIAMLAILAATLTCYETASAEAPLAPVVLITPISAGVSANREYGLIGSMIEKSSAKRTGLRISGFSEATKGVNWAELAASEFACIGVAQGSPCRRVILVSANDTDLMKTLKNTGSSKALLVELVQMHEPYYYRARVAVREVDVRAEDFKVLRTFTAVHFKFAPDSKFEKVKDAPEALNRYWLDGQESLIVREGKASLSNLKSMLDVLFDALPVGAKVPAGWPELQPVKELVAAGKAKCGGGSGCSAARVYSESAERIVLTMKDSHPKYGWSLVSLDPASARRDANVLFFLMTHEL